MKILKWLDENLEKYVCVGLFIIFIAIMLINIFMRFVLQNAIPWASDAVLFIFVWFVWFAISYGFKEDAHIRVVALVGMLPEKIQVIIELICNFIIVIGFATLFIVGVQLLGHNSVVGKTGLLIKYPMWMLYISTPIGLFVSIIRILQQIVTKYKKLKYL